MPKIKKRNNTTKKQPEQEVMTIAHYVSEYFQIFRKYIIAAAVALVSVLVLVGGYMIMISLNEKKAEPLVAVAYEYYSPAGAQADYQKALSLFRDVQKKYSNTMSGAIAAYYVGNCLTNLGQTEDALKAYQQFVQDYSGRKFLLGLVYQRMGYVYVALNKPAEAIKAWEQAETINGPGVATAELARLYEATGNLEEAQKKYKLIIAKLGGTTWAIDAMAKSQFTSSQIPMPGTAKEAK